MTRECPKCGGPVNEAGWCEACEQRITRPKAYRFERRSTSKLPRQWLVKRKWLHTTAALMSLVVPGAGQVYKGRIRTGVLWFVIVVGCYLWVGPPAALVHLMCIITAGSAARVLHRPVLYEGMGWPKR
ncbi:MAG TPA: hypothetical protein VFH27_04435 [Longimicrobiaceae bacterium]|nr:hypothetical protein [Longimicrobiaceae bacterium]